MACSLVCCLLTQKYTLLQQHMQQLESSRASYADELAALQTEAAGLKQVWLPPMMQSTHLSAWLFPLLGLCAWDPDFVTLLAS